MHLCRFRTTNETHSTSCCRSGRTCNETVGQPGETKGERKRVRESGKEGPVGWYPPGWRWHKEVGLFASFSTFSGKSEEAVTSRPLREPGYPATARPTHFPAVWLTCVRVHCISDTFVAPPPPAEFRTRMSSWCVYHGYVFRERNLCVSPSCVVYACLHYTCEEVGDGRKRSEECGGRRWRWLRWRVAW